ncbi:hypothetical protein K2D_46750 (plasmid) [Planctomycetes bacterium K2D]|nr:hypothetical protein K2D_46750 [Planctomycetes bacterium K2D]
MIHTTKRRLPSTATLLAELRELRQDVAQLTARLVAADGDDAVPAGGLRPYTVGEHDCRYLTAESLHAALPKRHKYTTRTTQKVSVKSTLSR